MASQVFKKASKSQAFLRMALCGPGGSGKTWTALMIATAMAAGKGRIALVDSERGSASKYAGDFDFDVLELESFEPGTYVAAIKAAQEAGYAAIVIDSLSHAWSGKGGALEQVDKAVARAEAANKKANSFTAWREVTPMHNALVDAMLQARMHLIATMRVKTEFVVEEDERGRTRPKKVGLAPIQRDGLEYEFDIIADINTNHDLVVGKTRCSAVDGFVGNKPGPEFAEKIRDWLTDGAPMKPAACPPEIRQLAIDTVKAWSRVPKEDLTAAFSSVMKAAGVVIAEGEKMTESQAREIIAWVKSKHESNIDFVEATAHKAPAAESSAGPKESVGPRPAWPTPKKKPGPGHVVYWRDQIVAAAGEWSKANPKLSINNTGEEIVAIWEVHSGMPKPGSIDESKAAQIYKAALTSKIDWQPYCTRF